MRNLRSTFLFTVAVVLASIAISATAQAEIGPPIKLLVGFPPGGSSDALARVIAREAAKRLGREIVVINKVGWSGSAAASEVASSPPDGSTLGIGPCATFTISHLFQNSERDLLERTEGLLQVGVLPVGMIVKADNPIRIYSDFVDAARRAPGKIAVGIPGAGTSTGLLVRAMFQRDNIHVNLLTFRGDVPAALAVLSGHVLASGLSAGGFARQLELGSVRLIVAMSAARLPIAPDVPTMKELGFDFTGNAMQYMYAPKGLPAADKKHLIDVLSAVIATPAYIDVAKKYELYSPTSTTAEALDRHLLAERSRYAALVARLGLKP